MRKCLKPKNFLRLSYSNASKPATVQRVAKPWEVSPLLNPTSTIYIVIINSHLKLIFRRFDAQGVDICFASTLLASLAWISGLNFA